MRKNINKPDIKTKQENIKNNVLNILFEQLKIKFEIDNETLIKTIKNYLNQIKETKYNNLFNNKYYNDLLRLIERKNNFSIAKEDIG